jgi:diguanylate cyclase (GGDEF)-like protein/PAS domain S-box-containing protein
MSMSIGLQADPGWLAEIRGATEDRSSDAVVGVDDGGGITYWNAAAERLFGWSRFEALGEVLAEMVIPERYRSAYLVAIGVVVDGRAASVANAVFEIVAARRDGQEVPVEVAASAAMVRDRVWVRAVVRDATRRQELEGELRQQGLVDSLTGLANRTLLFDRLAQAVSRLDRSAESLAVLFVDLDRFKVVNDGLGHEAGDLVLIAIAERVASVLRGSDSVSRYGGDEFVVLCEGVSSARLAGGLAERICRAIKRPIHVVGRAVIVTASVGVALVDRSGSDADVLRDADAAMSDAKRAGGDGHAVFAASARRAGAGRLDIEIDLRAAIERSELRLVYQPTIDLRTGRVTGTEALVRWDHPRRGTIAPLDFIPLAEETGLIVPIGAWVLNEACDQLRRWKDSLGVLAPRAVSVNLSGRQLAHGRLADVVAAALDRSGLDPSSLCLELTESALMDDAAGALEVLGELRDLGVRLSVDDFGTGYSSLLYLRRLPVSELKIDRIFVAGLGRNPEDTAIVEGVIALGHALKLTVVAEGVETADQAESLRHLRAEVGQGYYWSRPIPPGDLAELLESSHGAPAGTVWDDSPGFGPISERDGDNASSDSPVPLYRVLLIDDARPERELLRTWLEDSARFLVAGEAESGRQGVALAAELCPDVVVLDMSMPGMSGMDTLRGVLAASPRSMVVVVSGFVSTGLAQAVIDQGGSACLDKSIGPLRLVELLLEGIERSAVEHTATPVT